MRIVVWSSDGCSSDLSSSPAPAPLPATQPSVDVTSTAASASYHREADYRVARIGYRIGLSGARYCPDPYPLTGLLLHHLAEYGAADRTAAAKLYSLDQIGRASCRERVCQYV